jgi:hypothetical protein
MSVFQLRRQQFALDPGSDARDARILMTKLAAIELASDALIEALEATIGLGQLIKRFSEQPTPVTGQLLEVVNVQLQKTLTGLGNLREELNRL